MRFPEGLFCLAICIFTRSGSTDGRRQMPYLSANSYSVFMSLQSGMLHGRRAGSSLFVIFFSIFSSRVINYKFSFLFSSGMVILQPQAAAFGPHGHGMPHRLFPRIAYRVFLELMEKIGIFFAVPGSTGGRCHIFLQIHTAFLCSCSPVYGAWQAGRPKPFRCFFQYFFIQSYQSKRSFLFSSGMVILQPQAAALNPHGHGMPRGIFPRIAQRVFLELMEKIKTFFLVPGHPKLTDYCWIFWRNLETKHQNEQ